MRRGIRDNMTAVVCLFLIWGASLLVGGYIVAHQRIHPPSWVPIVGQKDFTLHADLTSVAGILPGQGQAVTIAGVNVGSIKSVDLKDGVAVATMRIKSEDARIYPNATVLLRPKTGLKDMVAELDPGSASSGAKLKDGATLTTASTNPDVNLDEILAGLDADTRDELVALVTDGGTALTGGGGHDLSNVFRDFDPLSRNVAKATRLVAERSVKLKRLMGNLSSLATELGARDTQLARFVQGSEGTFRRFAAQNANLQKTISALPAALTASNTALGKVDTLGTALHGTLSEIDPAAKSLAPTLQKLQPFLKTTTPVLEKQLRPFARDAQPTAKLLVPAARDLAAATPNLTTLSDVLDSLMNELAYDPPGDGAGQQSTLFYVPWASHDTNSSLSNQDGIGPIQRGMVALSCGNMTLLDSLIQVPAGQTQPRNPTLDALIRLLNTPDHAALIAQGKCPKVETAK